MRLTKARVTKYRSIRDSGWFDIDDGKTIMVGPNEAGKTALLQALQQLNPPLTARHFDTLRDYPRSEYADFTLGKIHASDVTVVIGKFELDEEDKEVIPAEFRNATYVLGRKLDNTAWHHLEGGGSETVFGDIAKDLAKLAGHVDAQIELRGDEPSAPIPPPPPTSSEPSSEPARDFEYASYALGNKAENPAWQIGEGGNEPSHGVDDILKQYSRESGQVETYASPVASQASPAAALEPIAASEELEALLDEWAETEPVDGELALQLSSWLKRALPYVDRESPVQMARVERLNEAIGIAERRMQVMVALSQRVPVFVLFSNYFQVMPLIHLEHLAERIESGVVDDSTYDYGNKCFLQLLGFTARELSNLGKAIEPSRDDLSALQSYRNQLDYRSYQLSAASARLSEEVRAVWSPDPKRGEAERLRVIADQQYLKVVVEDELGVEIELDQRSEGFQWLVSFFIVFSAESAGRHKNAVLLLDEPAMNLHGLKQRDFREAISRLAQTNQTIFTTHSPFLVGPDELDRVRVVEMADRKIGTKVYSATTASDPAALLPLQEAVGYALAQDLFTEERNLVVEELTDFWYFDVVSQLMREGGVADLSREIALVPAAGAGKVVYYATILHAQKVKVAALLDTDAEGQLAADQDQLVEFLGNKSILRTRDAYDGLVANPRIEDLLRETLIKVAKTTLRWDIAAIAKSQPEIPIARIFAEEVPDFTRYKLAKAFLRWARLHEAEDLTEHERNQWKKLIDAANVALR